MMKRYCTPFFLFSLMLFFCSSSEAQNTWDKREAVGGSKRERGVGFSIGSRGYVTLGQDTNNLMLNDLWEYDPGTNSWTQKANFPGMARRDAAAFSIGTKGYVGTGMSHADAFIGNPLPDFWEYNPATNSWTSKAPYPGNSGGGIYYASGFAVSGKGYFCCGKRGSSWYSNELWEYNPLSNSWLAKAAFPGGARYGGVAFSIGNYAYYGTGTDENVLTNDFYRYNPATNSWSVIAAFPSSGRFACCSFTLASRGYILYGTDGGYKDELWEYNPLINYWTQKASYPDGERRSGVAFTVGSRAYAGTGKGLTGTRRDFHEYTAAPVIGIEELNTDVISSLFPNPFKESATVVISNNILTEHQNLTCEIMSIEGRIIQAQSIESPLFIVQRNEIPSGIYFLIIRSEGNFIASKKLIVQ
jgi:N-acetylneuraminic acid mutarotase